MVKKSIYILAAFAAITFNSCKSDFLDRYSIVFNGEIYNYEEIRNDLIHLKYNFKSHSDTEVVMAAFDAWGHDFVHKCIGMFAFVLTDHKTSKVYIYRDRAGIKPIYLYDHQN